MTFSRAVFCHITQQRQCVDGRCSDTPASVLCTLNGSTHTHTRDSNKTPRCTFSIRSCVRIPHILHAGIFRVRVINDQTYTFTHTITHILLATSAGFRLPLMCFTIIKQDATMRRVEQVHAVEFHVRVCNVAGIGCVHCVLMVQQK